MAAVQRLVRVEAAMLIKVGWMQSGGGRRREKRQTQLNSVGRSGTLELTKLLNVSNSFEGSAIS